MPRDFIVPIFPWPIEDFGEPRRILERISEAVADLCGSSCDGDPSDGECMSLVLDMIDRAFPAGVDKKRYFRNACVFRYAVVLDFKSGPYEDGPDYFGMRIDLKGMCIADLKDCVHGHIERLGGIHERIASMSDGLFSDSIELDCMPHCKIRIERIGCLEALNGFGIDVK